MWAKRACERQSKLRKSRKCWQRKDWHHWWRNHWSFLRLRGTWKECKPVYNQKYRLNKSYWYRERTRVFWMAEFSIFMFRGLDSWRKKCLQLCCTLFGGKCKARHRRSWQRMKRWVWWWSCCRGGSSKVRERHFRGFLRVIVRRFWSWGLRWMCFGSMGRWSNFSLLGWMCNWWWNWWCLERLHWWWHSMGWLCLLWYWWYSME